jgi:hypothetical protein
MTLGIKVVVLSVVEGGVSGRLGKLRSDVVSGGSVARGIFISYKSWSVSRDGSKKREQKKQQKDPSTQAICLTTYHTILNSQ